MPQVNSATGRLEVMQRELQQTDRYDDIINLPHHRSCTRPHMSMHNRAAQFIPLPLSPAMIPPFWKQHA